MILLAVHLLLLVLVLTTGVNRGLCLWWLARLRDLLLLQAGYFAWQTSALPSPLWLALAQWPVFYLLLRHARAHVVMRSLLDTQLCQQLEALQADLQSGILQADEVSEKELQAHQSYDQAYALTGLGIQTGFLAVVHLGLLLFSQDLPWGSWLLWVNLPALIQSKIQDILLSDHVPHRLC